MVSITPFPHAGFELLSAPPRSPTEALTFRVAEASRCFDGHFDGEPILPGVAILALAVAALTLRAGTSVALSDLWDLRLSHPVRPGDKVEIAFTDASHAGLTRFEIRCEEKSVAAGLIGFRVTNGEP